MFNSLLSSRTAAPLLWKVGIACLALSCLFLALPWLDDRLLNGVSVWIKPWKFHVSVGIHLLTLGWAIALLPANAVTPRSIKLVSWVAVACSIVELSYIVFRASLGQASHFNVGTPLAGAMYAVMGMGAVLLTACAAVVGWWVIQAKDFALGRTLQLGLGLGLILGFLLGTITGGYMSAQPGHWVGGTLSDTAGLPLVKWSRDGGDLRVAHFFGLHAMQVLPSVALAFERFAPRKLGVTLVGTASLGYCVVVAWVFSQALAARPLI